MKRPRLLRCLACRRKVDVTGKFNKRDNGIARIKERKRKKQENICNVREKEEKFERGREQQIGGVWKKKELSQSLVALACARMVSVK